VDLAEDPVQVLDLGQRGDRQRGVDRVAPQEREVGQVRAVELDADVLLLARLPGPVDPAGHLVDDDHLGLVAGQGEDGVGPAAAQDQDPLALDLAQEPELGLAGDVGAVLELGDGAHHT
jgi:hypothetical protein